ncbi:uncharacterized protein LOC121733350 [Aricia agestis]|uniref:uncharacterized protein LOC121733350 n=1 Tax=Aricia agestis TaxID=91739 RepID=UPI001C204BEE|nr:uncharacterized protein LOC121733350 [Aricia agestis]
MRVKEEDIVTIANKLKTKSKVSPHELLTVKNGIMDNLRCIEVILNVHGALRGITRELTGRNAENKLAAAGCCCNLALGDERACAVVAKVMGSYLTTELDSLNNELAVTCAWALGNLAGSGRKACTVLTDQGAFAKLIHLLANEDLKNAAIYALEHYAYQMKDDLRPEHLSKMISSISQIGVNTETVRLLFILSCHNDFVTNITEDLLLKTLQYLPVSIVNNDLQLVYIIRTLGNSENYNFILNYFLSNNMNIAFKQLLAVDNAVLNNSLMWFLGNLYKYDASNIFFKSLLSS